MKSPLPSNKIYPLFYVLALLWPLQIDQDGKKAKYFLLSFTSALKRFDVWIRKTWDLNLVCKVRISKIERKSLTMMAALFCLALVFQFSWRSGKKRAKNDKYMYLIQWRTTGCEDKVCTENIARYFLPFLLLLMPFRYNLSFKKNFVKNFYCQSETFNNCTGNHCAGVNHHFALPSLQRSWTSV